MTVHFDNFRVHCSTCGWSRSNQNKDPRRAAREHAKRKRHTVYVELDGYVCYDYSTLTPEEVKALEAIADGADVVCHTLACTLRSIQASHPSYLCITRAMNETAPGGQRPFFGAILTSKGSQAIWKATR